MKHLLKYSLASVLRSHIVGWIKLRPLMRKLYPISGGKELIRLGPKGDGGYLVPNDFIGIEACFSPGVGKMSEFEKDCAELGMKVFLADNSVEGPASEHNLFYFTKKFIGASSSGDFITLDDWVESSASKEKSDLLLQIDIEGAEYEVFLSTSESLMQRFRIIVAEFHHLGQLWNKQFFKKIDSTFNKILQTHSCIHIHPNNFSDSIHKGGLNVPRVMEFTFLRNDRIENSSFQKIFPNPLDYDNTNNPGKPTIPLPKSWYSSK